MGLIIRKGDTASHPGTVTGSAAHRKCMGQLIARKGDIFNCSDHGPNAIVQGSAKWKCEGEPIARQGDLTACGASLISGQSKWSCS